MTKHAKINSASFFFLTITLLHCYFVIQQSQFTFYTKPFLMISLVLVYLAATKKPNFWLVSALFFSFWGDVFLLDSTTFFIHGLASFLIAHLLYLKITIGFLQKTKAKELALVSLPFIAFLAILLYIIMPNLGTMLVPVFIYGLVISVFGIVTLLNYVQQKSTANLWLFVGALFFIVSDSLLAINRFYETKEMYGITVIITYIIAQYLICKSLIAKDN